VWGTFTGAAAAICLLAGAIQGSVDTALSALQAVAIASAAPFVLILIGLCFSILKALREESVVVTEPTAPPEPPEPGRAASRPMGAPTPQQMSAENPRERGR
jgi:glycine betaine transporter